MLINPLNKLCKRPARKHNPRGIQFEVLTGDVKSNMHVTYNAFNKLRKKSKTKHSHGSPFQWLYYNWCCRGIGQTIWHLSSASLQISSRGSTGRISFAYCGTNHADDDQNFQRCRPETSSLCPHQQFNNWGGHKSCRVSLLCRRRLSWLIVPDKIMRFVWNTFLIVTWKKNLNKATILLSPIRDVLRDNPIY